MESNIFSFEKLDVWQLSREYVKFVYQLLKTFPREEQYAICDQIRRAVVSVPSNVAEGSGRSSYKEKVHFLEIAGGSLMETYCQLILSNDLGYVSDEDMSAVKSKTATISKLLNALRATFQRKLQNS